MILTIARAETPDDFDAVRALVRAFFNWAMDEVSSVDNPAAFADLYAEQATPCTGVRAFAMCLVLMYLPLPCPMSRSAWR